MQEQLSSRDIKGTDFKQMVRLYEKGHALREKEPVAALALSEQSLALSIALQDYEYQILSCYLKGQSLRYLSRFDEALEVMKKALSLCKAHFSNDRQKLANAFSRIGSVYYDTNNNQLAINYFLRSLSVAEKEPIRGTHINLAVLYGRIEKYDKALEYADIAIAIAKEKDEAYLTANHLYNKAYLYLKMEKLGQAKQVLTDLQKWFKTLTAEQEAEVSIHEVISLGMLGVIYSMEDNYRLALENTEKALDLAQERALHKIYCETLFDKAKLHFKYEEEEQGMDCIQELMQKDSKVTVFQKQKALKLAQMYYEQKGKTDKAYTFLKQLHDISQEELKTAKGENLKKIIEEREEEINLLEEKNREIKEHNAILEQFAHVISHDLREPIRGINGLVNLLDKYYGKGFDERGKEYMNFILAETKLINTYLARLLEYTSFKKPKTEDVELIQLTEIIEEIQQQYSASDVLLHVYCDDIKIKMTDYHARCLFGELIENAVKFRKKDEECKVEICYSSKGNVQHITVKDFGIGIDSKYHQKVFKIFNRLNKQENKGAGVGLAICERIASLYGGKIWIESVPNEQTTFHIEMTT